MVEPPSAAVTNDTPAATRVELLSVALAVIVTAVVAATLAPRQMESWDEIQIELGMRRFDLAWHQPHPPGYVLFVLAGRLVGALTHAAHPGRVSSAIAVCAWVVLVALQLRARRSARLRFVVPLLVPVVVLLSPTLLVHATTGRTYMVEATLWTGVLLTTMSHRRWSALALGALVGAGGGFRPTVLLWGCAAIAVFVLVRRRTLTRREIVELLAAWALAVLSWVSALAAMTGGLARYAELSRPLLRDNIFAKSIFATGPGPVFSVRLPLMLSLAWTATGPLLLVTAALAVVRIRGRGASTLRALDPLLAGAALAFVFYLFTIFDADGYSLSYLLPLLTWTALAGATVLDEHPRRLSVAAVALAGLAAAWAALPGGIATASSVLVTRARLQKLFDVRRAALDTLPRRSTLLVTGEEYNWGWNFRLLMYESPERPVLQLAHDPYFPLLDRARLPYLVAAHHQPMGAVEGVDLATLPFFTAENPLRYVVYTRPKEVAVRVHRSCLARATKLQTSPEETLPVIAVDGTVRVSALNGQLVCEAR